MSRFFTAQFSVILSLVLMLPGCVSAGTSDSVRSAKPITGTAPREILSESAAPSNQKSSGSIDMSRVEATADAIAQRQITEGGIPGLTIAVAVDGEVRFVRGYGEADVELSVAAGPETVYNIGSIPKQFAAAVVMRLVEQGKMSLDDPLTSYLPEYPSQEHTATIHHLLNHTSGIRERGRQHEARPQWWRLDMSFEEMIDLWGDQPPASRPGETFNYNNFAYYLLAEIISRVTGMAYHEYVEQELLHPLGLDQTMYCDRRIIPNRAEGYQQEDEKLLNVDFIATGIPGAAGGFCSSVRDIVLWTHLLHGGQIVSPESLERMMTPTVLSNGDPVGYGYALYLDELGEHQKVYHGGAANGFGSYLAHYPDARLTIAVLNNSSRGRQAAAATEGALARVALDVQMRDLSLTEQDVARYEGIYTYQSGQQTRELRVYGEEGYLKAEINAGKPVRLRYQGGHKFYVGDNDRMRLVFIIEDGRATGFSLHEGRPVLTRGERKQ